MAGRGSGQRPRISKLELMLAVAAVMVIAAVGISVGVSISRSASTAASPEETPPAEAASTPVPSAEPTPAPTPEPTPTPTPEPTPEPPSPAEQLAAVIMADMTLRDKVCQMMLVTPSAITGVTKVTSAGENTRKALEKYPVGGLDYNKSNMESKKQVAAMLQNTQGYARIPLILTCDEEGGRVSRLMSTIGTTRVSAMLNYKDKGPDTAYQNARTIAEDMAALGFNMDLAPVADVLTNPKNTVIGDRAYSDDYAQAAQLIPSAVAGFQDGGVACVLKHFPGHGGTTEDSHYGSAYVYRTLEELHAGELLPFQAGIDAGADSVMLGHLIVPDISEKPAVFCKEIVTGLLREEMGFKGVIMTDALEMQAISDHYGNRDVAVKAVQAGVDMLLCPMDLDAAIDALLDAVAEGTIPESRIDESVTRILVMKIDRGIIDF